MAGLQVIRNALAAVIQAGVGTGVNVSPVHVSQVNTPQIVIDVQPQVEVWMTLEGAVDYELRVILLASAAEDLSGQAQLDTWLDSSAAGSVVAAINQNPRLIVQPPNGTGQPVCDYCVLTRIGVPGGAASRGGYSILDWAGVPYLGTNLMVEVAANLP